MQDQNTQIKALISLLDDPDVIVFEQVRSKLEEYGNSVIPVLERAWEQHEFGPLFEERVEELIQYIQNTSRLNRLSNWVQSEDRDLEEGLVSVATYQYPEVDKSSIGSFIDKLEKDIWLELNNELTALEKLKVINHIIFDVYQFGPNKDDYHNPDNSYINRVIETRKGNPISLSCLYLILAKRLNLPIVGINLPRHFILGWGDIFSLVEGKSFEEMDMLFYFNPFSQGAVFGKQDISAFLQEINIEEKPEFFRPCNNLDIVYRTLNNLSYAYQKLNLPQRVEEVNALKKALK